MTISAEPWSNSADSSNDHILSQLPFPVLKALANSDLVTARALSKYRLTPYLASSECLGVWRRRQAQIELNPTDAVWVTRLVIHTSTEAVVGRAGFHGPPDEHGMVEVGYSIDPVERGRGHACAALDIMIDNARRDKRVKVVRATVRPDNVVSRRLIDQAGFKEVGEQWDEEDGLEIVLELEVDGK